MKNDLNEKKEELKLWLKKLDFTQKYFAGLYCEYIYVEPSEEFIEQFYEKLKKQIGKDSKDISVIEKYLEFLYSLEEFKNIGYIKPKFYFKDSFDDSFNNKMKAISKSITEKLRQTDD